MIGEKNNMKNTFKICIILFVFILLLAACSNEVQEPTNEPISEEVSATDIISEKYNISYDGYVKNYFRTIDVLYEKGDNYELYTDEGMFGFKYTVISDGGDTLDSGYLQSCDFHYNGDILVLNYNVTPGNLWYARYYDVSNCLVSRFFPRPVAQSGRMVAYFKYDSDNDRSFLIVQDVFDTSKFYVEIDRDFSSVVIRDYAEAEFLEINTKLKISYWIKPDDEYVTEIINLKKYKN